MEFCADKTHKTMKIRLLNFLLPMLVAMLGSCTDEPMKSTEAQQWISAYSSEMIDPDSRIRIEPSDTLRQLIKAETSLDNVFAFSPKVKGTAGLSEDGRFLDFIPKAGELKEGVEYECRLNLSALAQIDTLNDFAFRFHVAKREMKMGEISLRIDPNDVEKAIVTGSLVFSHDVDEFSADSKLLSCSSKGSKCTIVKTDDSKVLSFVVSDIIRQENDNDIDVVYSPVTSSKKVKSTVSVPGLKEFKLHSAVNNAVSEPYISLEFTSPLDPKQDLDGIITLDRCDDVRIERNGASVKVYYRAGGLTKFTMNISDMVRSSDGRNLKGEVKQEFAQEVIPPAIEVPMSGTILPDGTNLVFPFKAVNLAAVDVEVVKIYASNVLHFLQDNELGDNDGLRRAGRLIYKKTIRLDDKGLDLHKWQNFSINLNGLFKQERAAIYNVRLSFRKAYSLYDRSKASDFQLIDGISEKDDSDWDQTYSYMSRRAPDYNWWNYSWRESDDPSKDSYYMESDKMPEYNLLASNIGLIVKKADNQRIWTTVSDIMTTAPLSGVRVTAYNYQLQEVGSGWTDSRGFADFKLSGKPFVMTATDGVSTSYLKVTDGKEKSTSLFEVSGKSNVDGVKGFVYGERGIWRPGDNIYLTLIVEDKLNTLPANHPVTMELFTPDGVLYDRQTLTKGVNGFYSFCTKTEDDAETGRWGAKFHVGGSVFNHLVQIESIKPNRLKVNIDVPEFISVESQTKANINAAWLTGVTAKNLKASLEVTLFNNDKPFRDYPDYRFSNPVPAFSQSTVQLGSGVLDSLGNLSMSLQMPKPENALGMLQANFLCRVAEVGGDESVTSKSVRYSPFTSYVGINLGDKEFETDTDLKFPVVTLDDKGTKVSGRRLEWKIYKLEWYGWWEGNSENLSRYVNGKSADIVASGELISKDGKAEIPFRLDYPSWGRYLVFVKDVESGHSTGGVVLIDWPEWRGRADQSESKGATILSFSMDKNKYEVGETASVYLPKSAGGRVLLSIENGSRVISRHWVATSTQQETAYRMKVTNEMTPNFYVHAIMLQPHSQTLNDQPIRLYGIQGAEVVDKNSILKPLIDAPDVILPQKEFAVKVREQDGRPMTYTLAIVDEGLLDINGFKTPNAWRTMNQKEALGVDTWDIYDHVIGAYAGKFTSVLSVGGDEALRAAAGKEKRFNPVVKFMGPFTTDGRTKTHKITLPMYVGSVRVMVVAAQQGAYGSAEKDMIVRSPLMLIPTLPRILSCGDKVNMPVNLFAMEGDIADVKVSVDIEGPIRIEGRSSQKVTFSCPDEKILDFALSCDNKASGMAKVTVKATSGSYTASETINIEVRNPHAPIVTVDHAVFSKGEKIFTWDTDKADKVTLEMSTLPSVNFSQMYSFVNNYSHYCTEQLSSRAMYLLYARDFLGPAQRTEAEQMIRGILKEISTRQLRDGGFGYWDSSTSAHQWATSMAGEVMTEAMRQGFAVLSDTYIGWIQYQTERAKKYVHSTAKAADLQQAYRLYTLAMAGKEHTAAMNRLKESKSISEQAKYRLAAAYQIIGKDAVAEDLLEKEAVKTDGSYDTFWSELRDDAMKLEALAIMGKIDLAMSLSRSVADRFSSRYYSTQELAFVSSAFSRLQESLGNSISEVTISYGDKVKTIRDLKGTQSLNIPETTGSVTVVNESEQNMYLSIVNERQPSAIETVPAQSDGVGLSVIYTDMKGQIVDIHNMKQGDEIYAEITVMKTDGLDSDSMALTFGAPSGWEIWNDRIHNNDSQQYKMDIRDDRVCWYFRLDSVEKKCFKIRLRAAYEGEYIMPATIVEDMYRADCRATSASSKVMIVK